MATFTKDDLQDVLDGLTDATARLAAETDDDMMLLSASWTYVTGKLNGIRDILEVIDADADEREELSGMVDKTEAALKKTFMGQGHALH